MFRNKFLPVVLTAPLLFLTLSCGNNTANLGKIDSTVNQNVDSNSSSTSKNSHNSKTESTNKNSQSNQPVEAPIDRSQAAKYTNIAKLLAGMSLDSNSPLAKSEQTAAGKGHQNFFQKAWNKLEERQLSKVKKWSSTELTSVNQSAKTVFYPFSGPDFLYAAEFFPQAENYILAGLEPVGSIPELEQMSDGKLAKKLSEVQRSLDAILNLSFFRTKSMEVDLSQQGVIPVLFVFLARTNHEILEVQHIGIDKSANIKVLKPEEKDTAGKGLVPGIRIKFVNAGETKARTLYYFSTDLSDSGLKKTPEFKQFVQQFSSPVTYLKAASYLMHADSFADIRQLILTHSSHLLQDDSGIPLKHFKSSNWDLKFYGRYTKPIDLFSNQYQADLRKVYQNDKTIKPLDFGIGYRYLLNESNLMLAVFKK